jgi:acetoin utilization deacetylase AcuC-like enzyme
MATPRIALATDEFFADHVPPQQHDEDPPRLAAARRGFERSRAASVAQLLPARNATADELARAHSPGFIAAVLGRRASSGWLDPDTYHSPASVDVALRASGAALALTDALMSGACDQGFGLWRPPGHHACADRAMGFCLFNHVAVAAHHALARGARRVLILDWDVHHGNGTQAIFDAEPRVLFISLHQGRPQYPETGAAGEVGLGEGRGFSVNVPFSVGASGATYDAAFRRLVLPIVEQYRPELTLVSAGYDAHERDPLGGMCLRSEDYGHLTRLLIEALGGPGAARVAFFLEGGYDRRGLSDSIQSTADALLDRAPCAPQTEQLSRRHAAELEAARAAQADHWRLG